jgi:hypothetical protein
MFIEKFMDQEKKIHVTTSPHCNYEVFFRSALVLCNLAKYQNGEIIYFYEIVQIIYDARSMSSSDFKQKLLLNKNHG